MPISVLVYVHQEKVLAMAVIVKVILIHSMIMVTDRIDSTPANQMIG